MKKPKPLKPHEHDHLGRTEFQHIEELRHDGYLAKEARQIVKEARRLGYRESTHHPDMTEKSEDGWMETVQHLIAKGVGCQHCGGSWQDVLELEGNILAMFDFHEAHKMGLRPEFVAFVVLEAISYEDARFFEDPLL